MIKTSWLSLLKYNKFTFGKQIVSQFVIFECKFLFSIIIFYFHKSNYKQDRFHTHAFNAISIKLFGNYTEYILTENITKKIRKNIIQYFPKDRFHLIGESTGCCTILLTGPWSKQWKEYIIEDNRIITYYWNRKIN